MIMTVKKGSIELKRIDLHCIIRILHTRSYFLATLVYFKKRE